VEITLSVSNKPEGLSYGDAVRGTAERLEPPSIVLPHTTLSATAGGPAVWVVDPDTMSVSIRQVTVKRYETGRVVLTSGVQDGELVVARGAQLLYPGRIVKAANEGTE
jgi:multidrug efflux pump subunit AcrA (membrane-fusion protein)